MCESDAKCTVPAVAAVRIATLAMAFTASDAAA
jgi:hypothetical protein